MKKQLVVIGSNFDDYRQILIEDYTKEAVAIRDMDFKVSNYKIIVDKIAIEPDSCIIFNRDTVMNTVSPDYILQSLGYTVDSLSHTHGICIRKEFLFPNLRKLGFSVPALFMKCIPPSKYYLQYYPSKNIMLTIDKTSEFKFGPMYSTSISEDKLGGLLIYYFFGTPIAVSKILISGKDVYVAPEYPMEPKPNVHKLTGFYNGTRVAYKKEQEGNRAINAMMDSIRYVNPTEIKCGKKSIGDIPKILSAPTCEVFVSQETSQGNMFKLIEVCTSHDTLTMDIVGTERFLRMIRRRFFITMAGEYDKGENYD